MSVGDTQREFQRQLDAYSSQWTPEEAAKYGERDKGKPPIVYNKPLEGRPMAAPNAIKGLPGKFRDLLAGLTARAEKLAGEVEGSVKNLHARMDDADKMKKEIDNTAAEMQQIVGMDNGGPA